VQHSIKLSVLCPWLAVSIPCSIISHLRHSLGPRRPGLRRRILHRRLLWNASWYGKSTSGKWDFTLICFLFRLVFELWLRCSWIRYSFKRKILFDFRFLSLVMKELAIAAVHQLCVGIAHPNNKCDCRFVCQVPLARWMTLRESGSSALKIGCELLLLIWKVRLGDSALAPGFSILRVLLGAMLQFNLIVLSLLDQVAPLLVETAAGRLPPLFIRY